MKTLIIAPSWLGDLIMAQSLFKDLKKQDPSSTLTVYAPEYMMPILARMKEVDDRIVNPFAHGEFNLTARWADGRRLKRYNFDRVFVLPNSFKSALPAYFAGIPERIGFKGESRYLLLNKIDLLSKDELIQKLNEWKEMFDFKEIIPISALNGDNVEHLMDTIKNDLKEGVMYYPKDHLTDHPERFVMAEFIREKILYFTREEVPHSVAIVIERMLEDEDGVEIIATIVCDRKSQKGIIVGKQGAMIKKIRLNAQREMKRFLQVPVHLELFVKVENNWRNKQKYLKEFGYNEDDY